MDSIKRDLGACNVVDVNCKGWIFTGCRDAQPEQLCVGAELSGDVPVEFQDASAEVRIPRIILGPHGDLEAVLYNRWEGKKGSGYYSLLHRTEVLEVNNNIWALRDLISYVEGHYQPKDPWQWRKLDRNMRIEIVCTESSPVILEKLTKHFTVVARMVGDVVEQRLGTNNYAFWDGKQHTFTYCRDARPERIRIDAVSNSDVPIMFQGLNNEVHIPYLTIGRGGCLRSALYNRWTDGKKGSNYSLLHYAQHLEVEDNPQALRDLLDYSEGRHKLNEHWRPRELSRDMVVAVNCAIEDTLIVEGLRKHFMTTVRKLEAALKAENTLDVDCEQCIFTNCKGVIPQTLAVNAEPGAAGHPMIVFRDADGEIDIPHIVIGPKGCLTAVLCNQWCNRERNGYYSLLPRAKILEINDNPRALWDLAMYTEGCYNVWQNWEVQTLSRGMRIMISNPQGAISAVSKLVAHFQDVAVDNLPLNTYLTTYETNLKPHLEKYNLKPEHSTEAAWSTYPGRDGLGHYPLTVDHREGQFTVEQRLEKGQFIILHSNQLADIQRISITEGGCLRAVLQNIRFNGRESGIFSLLHMVRKLYISNSEALRDLLSYVSNKYDLDDQWRWYALDQRTMVVADCVEDDIPTVKQLRQHFNTVEVRELSLSLREDNTFKRYCSRLTFTNCRSVVPRTLTVSARLETGIIGFRGADNEVHVPHIVIGPHGSLVAVVHNEWHDGDDGRGGHYSLLWYAETLEIRDNPKALRDLADYVEGSYQPSNGWEVRELPASLQLRVVGSKGAFPSVMRLIMHIESVMVDDLPAKEYLTRYIATFQKRFEQYGLGPEYSMQAANKVILGGIKPVHCITGCGREIEQIVVAQQLNEDQFVVFLGNGPVIVRGVYIRAGGNLRSVLHNYWFNGRDGGFFSLLHEVRHMEISASREALQDLLNYVGGRYQLGEPWVWRKPARNIFLSINCTIDDIEIVKGLKAHFEKTRVQELTANLQADNVISMDCSQWTFTSCKGVQPRSLTINARISLYNKVDFTDTDKEVHIHHLTIGPRGELMPIVRNYWQNSIEEDNGKGGFYSLLTYATNLTIRTNPGAVQDLAAYVAEKYETGNSQWKLQTLDKDMRLTIEDVDGCEEDINALIEYFGTIVVDGRKEISKQRRQMLETCNETEKALRTLRNKVRDGWGTLKKVVGLLVDVSQKVQLARQQLQRKRDRLWLLMKLVQ